MVTAVPYVKIDNTGYYYRVSKRGLDKKIAAVCIHGSGADGVVWSYQLSRLSRDYKIIIADLPGHGRSGGKPLESTGAYAKWLEQLRTALDLSSFFIFGHSLGGAIAQEYARAYPEKIKGLVLVSTGTAFRISKVYNEISNTSRNSEEAAQKWDEYSKAYEALSQIGDKETLLKDMPAAAAFDSTGWISSIKIPALVIWGSEDIITPRDMLEELAGGLTKGDLCIIEGGGHVVMVDKPNEFNYAVKKFMERNWKN
jgi:pimeloyl-ACP methyl ester carboxylesterase